MRKVRGTALKIKIPVNVDTLDSAIVYVKRPDGTEVLGETVATKEKDGVYFYIWQTTASMEKGTYIIFGKATLGSKTTIEKTAVQLDD